MLVVKLILVSNHEIIATRDDAWSYVEFSNTDSFWLKLGPEPGYPLWIWFCTLLGIPQRVSIEILLGMAAAMFASGWSSSDRSLVGFSIIYASIIYCPVTYFLFDQTLCDGFYLCLVIAVSGIIGLLFIREQNIRGRWSLFVILGLLLGLMDITRRETPVTCALLVFLFVGLVAADRSNAKTEFPRILVRPLARIAVVVLIAAVAPCTSIAAHALTQGVWASSIAQMPSHLALLRRLASIDTGEKSLRFIPISRRARELAYANSPTLKGLEPMIEDKTNLFQVVSYRALGREGEIGAGWIWHVINAAGYHATGGNARDMNRLYVRVNQELDAAFSAKRLKAKLVIHPLLGSDFTVWMPYLLDSAIELAETSTAVLNQAPDLGFQATLFDRATLRRKSLIPDTDGEIKGWAFSSDGHSVSVSIEDAAAAPGPDGAHPALRSIEFERPDIQSGNAKEGRSLPLGTGFVARVPLEWANDIRLRFDYNGEWASSGELVEDVVKTTQFPNSHLTVVFGIDALPKAKIREADYRDNVLNRGVEIYGNRLLWLVTGILFLLTIGLLVYRWTRGEDRARYLMLACGVVVGWLVSRFLLYTVLNAAAWHAEPRYVVLQSMLLFVMTVTLLVNVRAMRASKARAPAG